MKNRKTIFIVDDNAINRTILRSIIEDEYSIIEAKDGQEALEIIGQKRNEIDLILLDLVMPIVDGMKVLEAMHDNKWIEDLPVVMISSETINTYISKAYELGATDYIGRPYDNDIVKKRIKNTIALYSKQKSLQDEIIIQLESREKDNKMMIDILSSIVEYRNGESGIHVLHINKICELLLNELLNQTDKYAYLQKDIKHICTASSLHDIGKIGIDEKILNKPGRLTSEEFEIMKTHTTIGLSMIENIGERYKDEPLIDYVKDICLYHHEKWDGKGYPKGLKEDEIPISAQVVSLADCYDALTSERCYKKAFSHEQAMNMLINGECGMFNPLLIKCLKNVELQIQEAVK